MVIGHWWISILGCSLSNGNFENRIFKTKITHKFGIQIPLQWSIEHGPEPSAAVQHLVTFLLTNIQTSTAGAIDRNGAGFTRQK